MLSDVKKWPAVKQKIRRYELSRPLKNLSKQSNSTHRHYLSRYITSSEVCSVIKEWGHKIQRIETSAKNNENCSLMLMKLLNLIDEWKTEHIQLNSLYDMTQLPLHKFKSVFRILPTLFNFIKNVMTCKPQPRRRRRRQISSSSSNDCTMQLLYVSLVPLTSGVKDYVNINW